MVQTSTPPSAVRHRVAFEAEGIKATISDIRIDRDVHYTQDGEWEIPEGYYFMLGDNTTSSKDSRAWKVAEVYLKDGTVIRWEEGRYLSHGDVPGQPNAGFDITGPDQVIEVKADVDGLVRRFHTRDVKRKELQDFVKLKIAPYKYPRVIEFVDALPRTSTGKVQRFRLREPDAGAR